MWSTYVSSRTQAWLRDFFSKVGYVSDTHSCWLILAGVAMTLLSSLGFLNTGFESDGNYLWVPTDSVIFEELEKTIDYFGEFETNAALLVGSDDDENLIDGDTMDTLFGIFSTVMSNISAESAGKYWEYDEICLKENPNSLPCDAESTNLFYAWGNTPTNWETTAGLNAGVESALGQTLLALNVGGDLVYNDSSGDLLGGTYARMVWLLGATSNDTLFDANQEWMQAFQDYFEEHKGDFDGLSISYLSSRGISDEIGRVISADIPIYITSILLMFFYLALSFGKLTCIQARLWFAVMTVVVMLMALVVGMGLASAFGQDLNTICFLLPYLLLGVGVDDEILLVESLDRTEYENGDKSKSAERMAEAMKHTGLSISLTSICSVIAFAIGANITMPGVRSFCVVSALAFLANYILQFLVFLPLLAIDEKRKNGNRNFCCPFITHSGSDEETSSLQGSTQQADTQARTERVQSAVSVWCNRLSIQSLAQYGVLPLLSKRLYRLIIIGVFFIIAIVSLVSVQWLSTDSDSSKFVPDDSFVITYLDALEDAYGSSSRGEVNIILEDIDISDATVRDNIYDMFDSFEAFDSGDAYTIGSVEQWLTAFEVYANSTFNVSLDEIDNSNDFYAILQSFGDSTENAEWNDEIIYDDDDNPTQLKATKFYVQVSQPVLLKDRWPMRNSMNELISDNLGDNSGYAYSGNFPFAYFEFIVTNLTLRNIAAGSVGVFFVLCILMDIRLAVFIFLTVLIIDCGLFGWMVLWGVALDSLAYIQLVMAVGLTVDYVIHITHSIVHAEVEDEDVDLTDFRGSYNARLKTAMLEMGAGVIKGAWTTFVGVFALAFSSSAAFRGFFTMFAGVIIVALLHGVLFVPAILGELPFLFGAHSSHDGTGDTGHTGNAGDHASPKSMLSDEDGNNQAKVQMTSADTPDTHAD